jgi:drug/metabolite transporter (DMT)-like permease
LAPGLPSALAQSATATPAGLISAIYLGLRTLVLGFLLLGEVPTTLGMVGGVLALARVVLVNLLS